MEKEIQERRWRILEISPSFFLMLADGGEFKIRRGIPKGSVYCGVNHDPHRDIFLLKIFNKDFEPVPLGEMIPILDSVVIERTK